MSRREIRRGIRWCKANLSAACCRTARLPQALAPTGVDPPWGRCRQVCTSGRREPTSPCTIGFPFGKTFGKKKSVHLAPTLPFGKKKTVHSAPTLPFGRKKKKCTPGPNSPQGEKRRLDGAGGPPRGVPEAYIEGEPLRDGKNESVHLAPTLLRESWGDLTVRGGLRAVSQRLI